MRLIILLPDSDIVKCFFFENNQRYFPALDFFHFMATMAQKNLFLRFLLIKVYPIASS